MQMEVVVRPAARLILLSSEAPPPGICSSWARQELIRHAFSQIRGSYTGSQQGRVRPPVDGARWLEGPQVSRALCENLLGGQAQRQPGDVPAAVIFAEYVRCPGTIMIIAAHCMHWMHDVDLGFSATGCRITIQ